MHQSVYSPFPTPGQELLLKAALLKEDDAKQAWRQWRTTTDFERDVDSGSQRLLPLVFLNLLEHRTDDPAMLRLKGMYRKTWSANHFLFRQTANILNCLQEAGIPVMVLKGIPLTILYYKNHALRPMSDMDIMVPLSRARDAIGVLKNNGWSVGNPAQLEFFLKYGRSTELFDADRNELDLHWHPVFETYDDRATSTFWDKAITLEVAGVQTQTMCPADTLFHVIVHGFMSNNEPPVRWVPDSLMIIRQDDCPVDWGRLTELTGRYSVSLQMKEGLNYLHNTFNAPIPGYFMDRINKIKPRWADRLVYRHAIAFGDRSAHTFRQRVSKVYVNYIRQAGNKNFFRLHLGFIRYAYALSKGRFLPALIYKYFRLLLTNR